MSKEQSPPPLREVTPYKPGKRQSTFRRLNVDFAGTALEQALEERNRAEESKSSASVQGENFPAHDLNTTPVATPVDTPVATPVAENPLSNVTDVNASEFNKKRNDHDIQATPVTTGPTTPVTTPVATPAIRSASESTEQPKVIGGEALYAESPRESQHAHKPPSLFQKDVSEIGRSQSSRIAQGGSAADDDEMMSAEPLDATHSGSEQKVYSVMYRETISKGVRERHFGFKEISRRTGIRSDYTVRKAIDGLIAKCSIEIVGYAHGNPLGPRYRIYKPREIDRRRRAAGIVIDPQSKKIVQSGIELRQEGAGFTPASAPVATGVGTGGKTYGSTPANFTGATPANIAGDIKYINRDLRGEITPASSSSKSGADPDDDDANSSYLDQVRDTYERATGNAWTAADAETVMRAKEIPAEVWGIAICYCLDRAPNHTYQRLAYVLEEARMHYETMKGFSQSDLRAILKHYLRTLDRVRAAGTWDPRALGNSGAQPS